MSDLMLLGVLRMPLPDNPADMGVLEWAQVKDRMRQAADEVEKERAAVDGHIRLIEVLEEQRDTLRAELAAAREAHEESNENYMQLLKEARAELAAEREWKRANIELAEQLVTVTAELAAARALLREAYKVVSMSRMHDGLRHRMSTLLERHDDE